MRNRMKKTGFYNRLLRKYRLTIHNENKLENVLGFYISPLWVILSLFFSFLLVAGVLFLIFMFTPVRNILPKEVINDGPNKRELIDLNLRIDSIIFENRKLEQYTSNIKAILSGNITADSIKNSPKPINADSIVVAGTAREEEFVKEWEEREKFNITSQASNIAELQELTLFRPASGEIVRKFNPSEGHYGVDIAETPGENILAIHDGIVVMSDYTANDGYTIVLQHRENMISVYRNCHSLLKSVGDKVTGGEAIGTLDSGNGENGKEKEYMHLELWHRGKALDPNVYIAF